MVAGTGEGVDPADAGWTNVKATFHGKTSIIVDASVSAGEWLFAATNVQTASVAAGNYRFQLVGTYDSKIYELLPTGSDPLADRVIEIQGTAAVSAASDQRTHNEIMRDKYAAEIQSRIGGVGGGGAAGSAHETYANGDVSLQKVPLKDLEVQYQKYVLAVSLERNGGRLPPYAAVFRNAR